MLKLKWEKHNTPSLGWKLLTGREEGKALGPLSSNHSGSVTRSGAELAEQSFRAVAPPLQQSAVWSRTEKTLGSFLQLPYCDTWAGTGKALPPWHCLLFGAGRLVILQPVGRFLPSPAVSKLDQHRRQIPMATA